MNRYTVAIMMAGFALREKTCTSQDLPEPLRSVLKEKGYEVIDLPLVQACDRAGLLSPVPEVKMENAGLRYGC